MYVAITGNFMSAVLKHISNMREKELLSLGSGPEVKLTGNELWVESLLWQGRPDLKHLLPAEWIRKPRKLIIRARYNNVDVIWANVKEGTAIAPTYQLDYDNNCTINYDILNEETIPVELVDAMEHYKKKKAAESRWSEVRVSVRDFLDKCKSLNHAMKLWPGIALYIPQEYIEKANEKAERKAQTSEALDTLKRIDTDAIEAAAIIARLSTQS
jgi:hypothetical protein